MTDSLARILAVDRGDERIGLAVSDLTKTIANPLTVIRHVQREQDALAIITIAKEQHADLIIVGQAFYTDGLPNPSGRKSARLAESIQKNTDIPTILWDENESTKLARNTRKEMGAKKKKLRSHMDDLAATIILQSYLDSLVDRKNFINQKEEDDEEKK